MSQPIAPEGTPPEGNAPPAVPPAPATQPPAEAPPTFTQDQVNSFLADQKRTHRQELKDAETNAAAASTAAIPGQVADALRTHLVALHQIEADDAELFLTATEPGLLLKQVERLTGRQAEQKPRGPVAPREGATPPPAESDEQQTVRNLFGDTT